MHLQAPTQQPASGGAFHASPPVATKPPGLHPTLPQKASQGRLTYRDAAMLTMASPGCGVQLNATAGRGRRAASPAASFTGNGPAAHPGTVCRLPPAASGNAIGIEHSASDRQYGGPGRAASDDACSAASQAADPVPHLSSDQQQASAVAAKLCNTSEETFAVQEALPSSAEDATAATRESGAAQGAAVSEANGVPNSVPQQGSAESANAPNGVPSSDDAAADQVCVQHNFKLVMSSKRQ